MTQITNEIIAQNQVERFVSRFEPSYHLLACHAALPLVLTPKLVNYLRIQFLKSEGVPWIAEADLLLSDLCRPVGYELYVMDEAVRANLLHKLEEDQRFGEKRIKDIARLLLNYVKHLAKTNPFLSRKDLKTQEWGAMLYLDTEQTVREIARAISECVDPAELARLLKISQDFKQKISSSGQFQDFLNYAQLVNDAQRNREQVSLEAITSSHVVAGDELTVPKTLVNSLVTTFKVATIKITETHTIDFTIATLEHQSGKAKGKQEEWVINRQPSQAEGIIEVIGEGIELELMEIPPGTFLMGASEGELESGKTERPRHQVTVPSFFMGKYPITQAQWKAVVGLPNIERELNPNPSSFKGDNRPVENVSWYDAVEFCNRLSQHTGRQYRLPSEAEWEYACRAGTITPFHFGETITTDLANYDGTNSYGRGPKGIYREETTPVGSFEVANAFGLYDMHGNVWEWCADHWHDNYENAPIDGSTWVEAETKDNDNLSRVLRGGSWLSNPEDCRSASRSLYVPDLDFSRFGLRVVCVVGGSPRTLL